MSAASSSSSSSASVLSFPRFHARSLEKMPIDLLHRAFVFLTPRDLAVASSVSRDFHGVFFALLFLFLADFVVLSLFPLLQTARTGIRCGRHSWKALLDQLDSASSSSSSFASGSMSSAVDSSAASFSSRSRVADPKSVFSRFVQVENAFHSQRNRFTNVVNVAALPLLFIFFFIGLGMFFVYSQASAVRVLLSFPPINAVITSSCLSILACIFLPCFVPFIVFCPRFLCAVLAITETESSDSDNTVSFSPLICYRFSLPSLSSSSFTSCDMFPLHGWIQSGLFF